MIVPGFLARRIERFEAAPVVPPVEVSPPQDIQFIRTEVISSFDAEPAALNVLTEPFTTSTGQFTTNSYSTNTIGTLSIAAGVGNIVSSGNPSHTDARTGDDITMPQVFVSVDVTACGSSGSFSYDCPRVGISAGATNWYGAYYERITGQLFLEQCNGGVLTNPAVATITLTPPYKLGFSLVGTSGCVWTDTGSGWVFRGRTTFSSDLRTKSLTGYKAFCGVAKAGSGTANWTFDNLKLGRFGAFKVRDTKWVSNEDGSLVDFGGKPRFVATNVDPNAAGYLGVWELDTVAETVTQVGVIFESRDSGIWNDLSGHLCRLGDGTWQLLNATWGNAVFSGDVLKTMRLVTATNISEGSHVVVSSDITPPNIPSPNGTCYDPHAIKFGGEWWLAYTVEPRPIGNTFYPALAKTSDWSSWTAIGADTSEPINEGTTLLANGGDIFVMTGGRGEQIIYDDTLTEIANALDVDVALYSGTDTQPWPTIGAWGDEWLLMTFDNTGNSGVAFSWGNLWLYRAPRYEP